MTKYENDIRFCGKKLESTSDKEVIIKYLGKLSKYRMTCELLKSTNIATLVRSLERREGEIGAKASELIKKWMDVVTKTQQTSHSESRPKDGKPKSSIKVNVEIVEKRKERKDSSRYDEDINKYANFSNTSDNKYSIEYDPEYTMTEPDLKTPSFHHVEEDDPQSEELESSFSPVDLEPSFSPVDLEPSFSPVDLKANLSPDFDNNYEQCSPFEELVVNDSVAFKHKLEPHDLSPCEPTRKKTKLGKKDIDCKYESLDEYKYKNEVTKKEHHKSHSKSHSTHKNVFDMNQSGDIELRLEPSKHENVHKNNSSKENTSNSKTFKETYNKSSKHEHHHKSKTNEKHIKSTKEEKHWDSSAEKKTKDKHSKPSKEEKHRDSNSEKKTSDKHSKSSKEEKHCDNNSEKKTSDKHSKSSKEGKHRNSDSEKKLYNNNPAQSHYTNDLVKTDKSVEKDKHHKNKSHRKEEKHKNRNVDEMSELLIKTKKHADESERIFQEKIHKKEKGKDKLKSTNNKISIILENFPKTDVKRDHDKISKSGYKREKSSTKAKELPNVKNKQSEEGFTSSDFSFIECLNFGNDMPTKKKKASKAASSHSKPVVEKHSKEKNHFKHKVSHSPVKEKRENKSKSSFESPVKKNAYSPSEPESVSDEDDDIKKHLEEFTSNPTVEYSLPQIQPNYRPLPQRHFDFNYDFTCNKKKVLTNEDAIKFTSSRREKTAVYSGRRNGLSEVPTLIEACVNILIENIDYIEYIGSIPYDLLKPVFLRASPKQLHRIEFYNPDLLDESQELWEAHCRRDFRKQVRQEDETWRDMYWRETEERQNKLRSITANISASMSKSGPARKVKLAYLDSAVKPPRDVARKQAKNGTAAKVIHSAVAKSSTPKTIPSPLTNTRESLITPSTSKTEFVPKYAKPKVAPLMAKTLKSIKMFTRRR